MRNFVISANREFEHNTLSAYHPEVNGKAESAVKVMKQLMAKALAANYDP